LIAAGLKENRCERCGIIEWQGVHLNMQLHHKNGNGKDNRLENLEFLCANCHSLTDTWGGRNGHRKVAPETPIVVTGTTQSLTKAEFIAQADQLCDTANTQIATIAAAGGGITQAAQIAQLRQGVVDAIRNLGTPAGGSSSTSTSTGITPPTTSSVPGSITSSGTTGTGASSTTGATSGDPLATFLTELEAEVQAGQKIDLAGKRGQSTASAEAELASAKAKAASAASSYGFLKCGTEGTASTSTTSTGATGGTVTPSAPSTAPPSSAPPTSGGTGSGSGGVSPGGGGVGPP